MRTINQEKFEARRSHIRRAALTCFRRAGFHGATMADICAEAGMSPGNLYRYYGTKEAIIAAICEDDRQRVTKRFEAMGEHVNLFEAMLELTGEAMQTGTDPGQSRFAYEVLAEAMRNERVGEIVRRHNASLLALCAGAIARAQAVGQIDPALDAEMTAAVLIGAAEGLGTRLALHPHLVAKDGIDMFKVLLLRFLHPRR